MTTIDRFAEEKSTYTVRGTDSAPDLEAGCAAIRNVLKTLPVRPGVSRMQDSKGREREMLRQNCGPFSLWWLNFLPLTF